MNSNLHPTNLTLQLRRVTPRLVVDAVGLMAIAAIAIIIRFHNIAEPAVWYDEAFSLLLAQQTPGDIWSITARDIHPPFYYLLLHYWMLLFGNGLLSARSLSALADVGTLFLCLKLISLLATRRAVWIAALLLVLLPISVRYSQEARMYTLLGFWLMGATLTLVHWVNAPQRKRFAVIYVLLMTAAFYTHYFAALCVLVHWLYWWHTRYVRQPPISARAWVGTNSAIVILFLPWLPHFVHHLKGGSGLDWIPPVTGHSVTTLVWQFMVMDNQENSVSLWTLTPTVLMGFCVTTVLLNARGELHSRILLASYFFVPALTLLLASLLVPIFVSRYLLAAAVGLPLVVAVAMDVWCQRLRIFAFAFMAIFIVGEMLGLSAIYSQMDGYGGTSLRKNVRLDWVATDISREIQEGDEILFESIIWYLPFMYYNTTGIQPIFYVLDLKLWWRFDEGGFALVPQHLNSIFFEDITQLKQRGKRIWWITAFPLAADEPIFAKDWKYVRSINGGAVNARLYIPNTAPTSP